MMNYIQMTQTLGALAASLLEKIKGFDRADTQKIGKATSLLIVGYFVTWKFYDAFFGPLSRLPGPLAFRFYDMRYASNLEKPLGTSWRVTKKWRDEYGDIVRAGPRRLIVSNKHVLRQIAAVEDCPKGPQYQRLKESRGGVAISTAIDANVHRQRRRALLPVFSPASRSLFESSALSTVGSLIKRIDSTIRETQNESGYGRIDIWDLYERMAIDATGHLAFSTKLKALEAKDYHPIQRFFQKEQKIIGFTVAHPIVNDIIMSLPFKSLFIERKNEMTQIAERLIAERVAENEKNQRHNDLIQALIDTQNSENIQDHISTNDMIIECVAFMTAGVVTTSHCGGFAVIHLLENPQVLAKLRRVLDGVEFKPDQTLLTDDQLKRVPYLNAFISESLRIDGLSGLGAERITDKDLVLEGGVFVPKGTILQCNFYHTHTDPANWPEPEKLLPERWLEGSVIPADKEAYLPFSVGPRNCIGQKVALQELRMTLGNLVKLYDFKVIPEQMILAKDKRAVRSLGLHSNSFKVLMKRREN